MEQYRKNDDRRKFALETIKEQRAALKNFYKIKETVESTDEIPNAATRSSTSGSSTSVPFSHKNSSSYSVGGIDSVSIEDLDEFIATESYLNILKVENKVLDKLNSAKSEIKSTIYNNYYELIKINNVLADLLHPKGIDAEQNSESETIRGNLNTIRTNIVKMKSLDMDIFDDVTK